MMLLNTAALLAHLSAPMLTTNAKIGTTAEWKGTLTDNGTSYAVDMVMTVTAIDATSGQMTVDQNIKINGNPEQDQSQTMAANSVDPGVITASACTQAGGQSDSVTVAAGTFAACHIVQTSSDVQVADVPFGVVKETGTQSDGSIIALELQSAHW